MMSYSPVGVFRVVDFVFLTWQNHDRVINPIYYCSEKKQCETRRKIFFLLFYQMMISVQIYFDNIMLETEEKNRWQNNNNFSMHTQSYVSVSAVYERKFMSTVCSNEAASQTNAFPNRNAYTISILCKYSACERKSTLSGSVTLHILYCVRGIHTFNVHVSFVEWVINGLHMRSPHEIHEIYFRAHCC